MSINWIPWMLIISRQVIGIARIENRSLDVQGIARLPSR
jgi:hypothetical protein